MDALEALRTGHGMMHRAAQWLVSKQNADGGWGETCHSYVDPSFAGVGTSTPSQTAWAVLGLQSAGFGEHPACRRGINFLYERQTNGTWNESEHTGTGFPGDFYINYHLYRHIFPTMALAADAQTSATLVSAQRSLAKNG
jgi:squalene-hopene/tetraprenyl-beta-curcumene cyclase